MEEITLRTREWFIENARGCIEDAVSGRVAVSDLGEYVRWQEDAIEGTRRGESDHTFAFLQRAHFIKTGECVPLLT
jgi:hypothetical protein